jgi:hypothetical protein
MTLTVKPKPQVWKKTFFETNPSFIFGFLNLGSLPPLQRRAGRAPLKFHFHFHTIPLRVITRRRSSSSSSTSGCDAFLLSEDSFSLSSFLPSTVLSLSLSLSISHSTTVQAVVFF